MTQGPPLAILDLRAPLIGRDAELRRLDATFERALGDGEARAVTLVGPAGMGKTRLVDEYLRTRAPSVDSSSIVPSPEQKSDTTELRASPAC